MTFIFEGLKPQIDDIYWLGTTVSHSLDADGGLNTSLQLEVYCPEADDVAELFDDQMLVEKDEKFTGVVTYYREGSRAIPVTRGDQTNPKKFALRLYDFKAAAEARADREYSLLDLETGKVKQAVTLGDQTNPKFYHAKFTSQKAAMAYLKKMLPKINAKADMRKQAQND